MLLTEDCQSKGDAKLWCKIAFRSTTKKHRNLDLREYFLRSGKLSYNFMSKGQSSRPQCCMMLKQEMCHDVWMRIFVNFIRWLRMQHMKGHKCLTLQSTSTTYCCWHSEFYIKNKMTQKFKFEICLLPSMCILRYRFVKSQRTKSQGLIKFNNNW